MAYYSNTPLNDEEVSRQAGARCYGLGTGESHERQILQAGGEIGYDGFKDPRPNQEGNIVADRVFINEKTNEIQGINFNKNGKFCCSYTGINYNDIKDSNQMDCQNKQEHNQATGPKMDEFGVKMPSEEHTGNEQKMQQWNGLGR